jgi:tetratricopeptide (TPR) repeat protein
MIRLTITVLCLALICSSAIAQRTQPAKEHFERALTAYQQGKFDEALGELDKAIQLQDEYSNARFLRGNLRMMKQDFAGALVDYNKVIELAPKAPGIEVVFSNRGVARSILGDSEGALADANRAISINPNHAGAYNLRGNLRTESGNIKGAEADFSKSIALDPNATDGYIGRGNLLSAGGDDRGALADFNRAIEINSNEIPAYVGRASIHYLNSELNLALSDYDKVLLLNPTDPSAHIERGVIHALKGQIEDCVKDIKEGLRLKPDVFDRSLKPPFTTPAQTLEQFIASNPKNARAFEARAIIRLIQHKKKESDEDFQRALAIDPGLRNEIDKVIKENQIP